MARQTIRAEAVRGLVKDNLAATSAPLSTNDTSQGYSVGSMLVNVTTDKSYICVDATTNNAILNQIVTAPVVASSGDKFTFVLHVGENAGVGTNKTNVLICTKSLTIIKAYAYADITPVGGSLIFDINRNGSTIWSTQANRLTIASGTNTDEQTLFNTTSLYEGDLLTIDIDSVGSVESGGSITVVLTCDPLNT